MKILVTGATGFLGSYLTKALLKEGHELVILKRSFSNTWRIAEILDECSVYNIDQCSLEQPFLDFGEINIIIHTATNYERNGKEVLELFESNVNFPLKLLDIASRHNTQCFINTDTISSRELNFYALAKKQFLEWGMRLAALKKIRFLNINLEHMYGPGDSDSKFTTFAIKSCAQNVPELLLTAGEQIRDFIYIEDVVSAYLVLLKQSIQDNSFYKEYDIGSGEPISIRSFVEFVHQITQSTTILKFGAIPYRANEIMVSKANMEELKKMSWSPKTDLATGINKVWLDIKNRE
jgi:CDP-paratose synthetase